MRLIFIRIHTLSNSYSNFSSHFFFLIIVTSILDNMKFLCSSSVYQKKMLLFFRYFSLCFFKWKEWLGFHSLNSINCRSSMYRMTPSVTKQMYLEKREKNHSLLKSILKIKFRLVANWLVRCMLKFRGCGDSCVEKRKGRQYFIM